MRIVKTWLAVVVPAVLLLVGLVALTADMGGSDARYVATAVGDLASLVFMVPLGLLALYSLLRAASDRSMAQAEYRRLLLTGTVAGVLSLGFYGGPAGWCGPLAAALVGVALAVFPDAGWRRRNSAEGENDARPASDAEEPAR